MTPLFLADIHIQLQKKLLNPDTHTDKPDLEFLDLFAEVLVARSKWSSPASLLSLTSTEMEEVKIKTENMSPKGRNLSLLKKWASKKEATYGHLYRKLNTIPLFHYNTM